MTSDECVHLCEQHHTPDTLHLNSINKTCCAALPHSTPPMLHLRPPLPCFLFPQMSFAWSWVHISGIMQLVLCVCLSSFTQNNVSETHPNCWSISGSHLSLLNRIPLLVFTTILPSILGLMPICIDSTFLLLTIRLLFTSCSVAICSHFSWVNT